MRTGLLAGGLVLVAATACGDTGVSSGRPLDISIEVDQPGRPLGAPHVFRIEAQGRALLGVILDYGDSRVDSIPTHGAQTASHEQGYIYEEEGVFLVRVRAEDVDGRAARDSLTVQVTPPS